MTRHFILSLALAAVICVPADAANPSAKVNNKKKAKTVKTVTPKVDTVSIHDFSTALGASQIKGLKTYLQTNLGIDTLNHMSDFLRGLKQMQTASNSAALKAYAAGLQIGQQVFDDFPGRINQQITGKDTAFIDVEAYKQAFVTAVEGGKLPFSVDSAAQIVQKQMTYYNDQLMLKKYGRNKKDGEDFLAENAKLPDVKTLPSGVQYKVIKQGKGPVPTATQKVKVKYEGRTIDGKVFDSTKGKSPAVFNASQVIKGWTDVLTHMPVGSTWEVYIPQELAYGNREAGQIKPFSTLIFNIELLGIEEDKPAPNK